MRKRENNFEKSFFSANAKLSTLAASMDNIYKKVNLEGLGEDTSRELEGDIKVVSERFGISPIAAVLLPAILEKDSDNGCEDSDLSQYLGSSNIEFISFRKDIQMLEDMNIIIQRSGMRGRRYLMSREAIKAIEKDTVFEPIKRTNLTADEVFTHFRIVYADYKRDNIDSERLLENLTRLIEDNQHLDFCRRTAKILSNPDFCDTEKRFFLTLCHQYVNHGDRAMSIDALLNFTGFMEDDKRVLRAIACERTDIQKTGLITFGGDEGYKDTDSLALSDEVRRTFFTEVTPVVERKVNRRDVLDSSSIKPKKLFYDGKVAEQMERLETLLMPENFKGVQQRLSEMGMRKGFAVLFTGGAGCGKTAGAYELARRTGRDIFAVDMSELKSKWVGDSEKIVKGVFNDYRQMCRTRETAPILLFNEADAIFTKRIEDPSHSADQMLNAIQNICLDAIENLDGILIATTNLASNFCDEAFERRFLFKVEFEKPGIETRAKIWQSMLDDLSDEDAKTLASRYDFSGGNIENIARKAAVEYVLGGKKADIYDLIKFCEEENLSNNKAARRIGFNMSA